MQRPTEASEEQPEQAEAAGLQPLHIALIGGGAGLLLLGCLAYCCLAKRRKKDSPKYREDVVIGDLGRVRGRADESEDNAKNTGEQDPQGDQSSSKKKVVKSKSYQPGDRIYYDEESFEREVVTVNVEDGTIVMTNPEGSKKDSSKSSSSTETAVEENNYAALPNDESA